MRGNVYLLAALLLPLGLSACGGPAANTAPVNINAVLDRTAKTLIGFDAYLRRYDYKKVDDAMIAQFNTTIQHDLNAKPRFHGSDIVTKVQEDASIMGYSDLNGDGAVAETEPKLFKMEFDTDNNRLIVTSAAYGRASGRRMPGGFFAGVMVGSLLSRQSRAGIRPGHFNNRNVAGAPAGRNVANKRTSSRSRASAGGSRARSRARSGGLRGGK